MISLIISVLASLSILLGSPAPVAAQQDAPVATVQDVQQQDAVLMQDVWQTVDDANVENTTDTEMMLDYSRTIDASQLGSVHSIRGEFALASLDFPNTYHVYVWHVLSNA